MATNLLLVVGCVYLVFLAHMINYELNKNGMTFKFFVGLFDISLTSAAIIILHSMMS